MLQLLLLLFVCMYVERNWLPLFHGCCLYRCKSNIVCKVKKILSLFHTSNNK